MSFAYKKLEKSKFDFSKALVIIISQSGLSDDLIECENKSKKMIIFFWTNPPLLYQFY